MTDVFIRRIYEYKGINVAVDIDLENKQISLVDRPTKGMQWQPKEWLFAERSLEYMNGWLLILDAMKHAISEAKKELEAAEERDNEKFMNMMIAIHKPLEKGKK